VAMESSGTYGDALRQALGDNGIEVQRVNGKAAHDYAEVFDGVPSQHDGKGGFKKINRPLDFCTMAASPGGGSTMELSPEMCSWLVETAGSFPGARRRRFLARAVEALGLSQRQAARVLGWARDTVRKGMHELHAGITCLANFSARGRQPIEVRLPALL